MSKVTILNQASAMHTSNGSTENISWGNASTIALDVNVTNQQGTSPTLEIYVDRLGADGVTYFNIYDSGAFSVSTASTTAIPKSASIGPGCTYAQELGASGQVRWAIGGSSSPGAQFSISLQGE
jgi:hypothetical protein